jgi:transmembrane sensor
MSDNDRDTSKGEALQEEARAWLRRLASGAATQADVEALERWRSHDPARARAFAEAALLWNLAGDAAKLALSRNPGLVHQTGPRVSRRVFIGGGAALAASLTGIAVTHPPLGLWPSLSELKADYRTRTGERRNIEVAGSVSVELNTRTSIDVHPAADGVEAIELLSGEAMIAKESDLSRTFAVLAGEGRATATRASFNIRKDGETVCVTCVQGEVRIQHRQVMATLQQQQQIVYDGGGLSSIGSIDANIVTAWQQGMLVFRDVPLARVIDEVNRYRPGRIIVVDPRLGRREVVADFRLDRLDAVVDFVVHVMKAPVRSLPGGIVLLG